MRVLFVHDNIFLTKGGKVYSNTFSFNMLKEYLDIFSEITVIARHLEVEDTRETLLASGEGITFMFLESISSVKSYFGLRKQHEKTIKKVMEDIDGVIVRLPSELGLMTAKIANQINKKYMIEVVGCAWDAMWNYGGWKSKIYAPFFYAKNKHAIGQSSYTTYVTEQFLQDRYPSSTKAKTIGVSDVVLADVDDNTLLQRIKKIENMGRKMVFGTIGSLTVKYKGIDIALKALSEIASNYDDFEYHVLGEGDPAAYMTLADELGIGDKVFFDGIFPGGTAVFNWMDSIDVYLQPSLQEGLPRALVEAMSRGCSCIGSSVGGIPELLDKDMIFSHKYPQEFSKIISTLINNKALMADISKRNFLTAKKYQKSLLDKKRKKFWIDFRDDLL